MAKFDKNKKIIISHFDNTIKEYKKGVKVVGWGSKKSQEIRFKILSEIGNLNGKTVLDVGCGLGDFYRFLKNDKKITLRKYVGIDINPLMISIAKKKYPGVEFRVVDLLKNNFRGFFDYILASGLFGLKISRWEAFSYKVLIKMYKISKIGIGANFLSAFTPFKKDRKSYYANPFQISNFIRKNLSDKFALRHDYKSNDFTVYIYKK